MAVTVYQISSCLGLSCRSLVGTRLASFGRIAVPYTTPLLYVGLFYTYAACTASLHCFTFMHDNQHTGAAMHACPACQLLCLGCHSNSD